MSKKPGVLLITTLDTKEKEAFFIRDCLEAEGVEVIMMDPGIRGDVKHDVAVSPEEIEFFKQKQRWFIPGSQGG